MGPGRAGDDEDLNLSDDKDFTPAGSIDDTNSVGMGNLDEDLPSNLGSDNNTDSKPHHKHHKKGDKKVKDKKNKKHKKKEKHHRLARADGEDIADEPKHRPNYDENDNDDEDGDIVGKKRRLKRNIVEDESEADDQNEKRQKTI